MREAFCEGRIPERPEPLTGNAATVDFDWHEVESALGEIGACATSPAARSEAGEALAALFQWLARPIEAGQREADKVIGRRALAMVWVVRPDLIRDSPSLARLAARLGITRAALSWHAAAFTRDFGVRNRGQAFAWNRRRPAR